MNKEKPQRGLGLFLDAMRPYAVSIITRKCPEGTSWDVDFEQKIDNERKRTNWQMQRMQLNCCQHRRGGYGYGAWPQCWGDVAAGEERSLTPREDKGIVMGLIGWDGVLG